MTSLGYPSLLTKVGRVQSKITLLAADLIQVWRMFQGPRWGLWRNGEMAVQADGVSSLDVHRKWRISSFPVEQGAFECVNKVMQPQTCRIRLVKGGDESERASFLAAVDQAAASFDLYDVVMPEGVLVNACIVGYSFRRTVRQGAGLIIVDMSLEEVRASALASFSNTSDAGAADPTDGGMVQPLTSTTLTYGVA